MTRPLILLHGAIGSSQQLQPLIEKLRSENFNVHSFDFSGHGKEDFKQNFDIPQFASELMDYISLHKLKSPNIFGYSMGGYVALYAALRYPDSFGMITTLGTKFKWNQEIAEKEIKNLDPDIIEQKIPKFALRLKELHGEKWKELLRKTAHMMKGMGELNPLSEKDLNLIKNKVSIGLADQDKMVSVEETEYAASLIKNASRFTLLNASHPIETTDPITLSSFILKD